MIPWTTAYRESLMGRGPAPLRLAPICKGGAASHHADRFLHGPAVRPAHQARARRAVRRVLAEEPRARLVRLVERVAAARQLHVGRSTCGAAPDSLLSIGLGNAALLASFACCWQGARAFDRRPPLWSPALLTPLLWLAACLVPGFLRASPTGSCSRRCLIAPLLAMAAVEFWRGRAERLPSRWPVIVIFASFALFFAVAHPADRRRAVSVRRAADAVRLARRLQSGRCSPTPSCSSVLLVALSKERLELDQRTKAQTDPLTGALNRRAFMSRGARLLQRHAHERAPLCLLFLDLDHFKSLNDRFGHSGGDDVLTSFVDLVNACIRPTDFLFRIGGEEFCCLLPHTTTEQAHRVAERIRHQFEMTMVDVAGTAVKATASLGIASTDAFGYELDTLMRRADMAVYAAKRAGRNRVDGGDAGRCGHHRARRCRCARRRTELMIRSLRTAIRRVGRTMDRATVGAYDAGAAAICQGLARPAGAGRSARARRTLLPPAAEPPTSAAAAAARWRSSPPTASTPSATTPPTRCSNRRGCAIRGSSLRPRCCRGWLACPTPAFDNVLCETVIMHLRRPQILDAVRRLLAILKPGGILYLSWRVTEGADQRDPQGRLYSAFESALIREAVDGRARCCSTTSRSALRRARKSTASWRGRTCVR